MEPYIEIPRIYTVIAESMACILYLIPMAKRKEDSGQWIQWLWGPVTLLVVHIASE